MNDEVPSLKGHLLLDGGKLQGSFFSRTVVLVCQHDKEGAFGLVLNRPSDNKIREVVIGNLPDSLKEHPVYLGGPVQPRALSFLHTDAYLPEANVLPNLNLGHSIDSLSELGESFSSGLQVRVFAGYSGWSAGQLDDEIRRGAWLTHPATLELVFNPDPKELWQAILRQKGWRYRLLSQGPDDLSWN